MKNKGLSLATLLIAIAVLSIISLYFGKFYVLMMSTYDQISVRSEIQRNMRKIAAYIVPEVWEASPAGSSGMAFLEPTGSSPTSQTLRFTRPVNLSNPSSPTFETIRYEYVANDKTLYRQVVGSAGRRAVCLNLSSLSFTWISPSSVRLNFTVSRQVRRANHQEKTLSANGETFLVANDQCGWVAGTFSTSSTTTTTTIPTTTTISYSNTPPGVALDSTGRTAFAGCGWAGSNITMQLYNPNHPTRTSMLTLLNSLSNIVNAHYMSLQGMYNCYGFLVGETQTQRDQFLATYTANYPSKLYNYANMSAWQTWINSGGGGIGVLSGQYYATVTDSDDNISRLVTKMLDNGAPPSMIIPNLDPDWYAAQQAANTTLWQRLK